MKLDLPRVIGHRGACADAPENTLESFREAHRQGARWIEFDVRLARDDVAIVLHDTTLDRTTTARGPARAIDSASLATIDAGSWFGPAFAQARVPTLAATLALASELGLGCNVELKAEPGDAAALAKAVAAEIAGSDLTLLLSSFDPDCVAACAEFAPSVPRGALIDGRWGADPIATARSYGCTTLNARADQALGFTGFGLPVLAYTVNDPGQATMLWARGIAGVFSDRPGLLLAAAA
ncbi:glycerophosphodiester phosphodiesterase family protein [Roseiterribacter gracilis]|uniref:Glycerophosphodiester phosphodiesterase n=1 Tax=Roseiterribacter gracilis TaxID=2812848 RepID=A0A8S8XC84_9PROT|nr:glycerophosphodiester phosphodiesterase [Rhodospirillales bacterium TMPK1]